MCWLSDLSEIVHVVSQNSSAESDTSILSDIESCWDALQADEAFAVSIRDLIKDLPRIMHLASGISAACGQSAPSLLKDISRLHKFDEVALSIQALQLCIGADLMEVSALHSNGSSLSDWTDTLAHISDLLVETDLKSPLSADMVRDQFIRESYYRLLLYTTHAQETSETLGHDLEPEEKASLNRFGKSISQSVTEALGYTANQATASDSLATSEGTVEHFTLLVAIAQSTWRIQSDAAASLWLTTFDAAGLIGQLLDLYVQEDNNSPNLNPYREQILLLFVGLGQITGGPEKLVASRILKAFGMVSYEGCLASDNVFILMLKIINILFVNYSSSGRMEEEVLPLIRKQGTQILSVCNWVLESQDSSRALQRLPEVRQTLYMLARLCRATAKHPERLSWMPCNSTHIVLLLSSVSEALSSERTTESLVDNLVWEKLAGLADESVMVTTSAYLARAVRDSLLQIGCDALEILRFLTDASAVVCRNQDSWRDVGRLTIASVSGCLVNDILESLLANIPMMLWKTMNATTPVQTILGFGNLLIDHSSTEVAHVALAEDGFTTVDLSLCSQLELMDNETRKRVMAIGQESVVVLVTAQAVMLHELDNAELEVNEMAAAQTEKKSGTAEKARRRQSSSGTRAGRLTNLDVKVITILFAVLRSLRSRVSLTLCESASSQGIAHYRERCKESFDEMLFRLCFAFLDERLGSLLDNA